MSTQPNSIAYWQLDWTFGDRLRKARRTLGLTTHEMGAALDVSGQAISNLESRLNTPRAAFEIADRLEQEYGIPAWWTLGHEKAPDPTGPGAHLRAREDSNPQPSDQRFAGSGKLLRLRRSVVTPTRRAAA